MTNSVSPAHTGTTNPTTMYSHNFSTVPYSAAVGNVHSVSPSSIQYMRANTASGHLQPYTFNNSLSNSDEYWPITSNLTGHHLGMPRLVHAWRCPNSVLSLVSTKDWIIAGCGDGHIMIFSKETFVTVAVLPGHHPSTTTHSTTHTNNQDYSGSSVYSLTITPDERFLFSAGADSLVKVWDLNTLNEIYVIYSVYDIGDIFSVAWIPRHEVLVFGAQNASIQWIKLYDKTSYTTTQDPNNLPSFRFDKFFDSKGPGGKMAPQQHQKRLLVAESDAKKRHSSTSDGPNNQNTPIDLLEIPPKNVIQYAHYGYVYSLLVVNRKLSNYIKDNDEQDEYLVSGGGDGTVKFWSFQKDKGSFQAIYNFDVDLSIFSMCYYDNFLYLGLNNGQVGLFDMDTRQTIRVDKVADEGDVMAMSLHGDCLFRGGAHGVIRKWDSKQYTRAEWAAHKGTVLSTVITNYSLSSKVLISGGSDNIVSMWDITSMLESSGLPISINTSNVAPGLIQNSAMPNSQGQFQALVPQQSKQVATLTTDHMLRTLRDFVAYQTVSGHDGIYANDCRRCAIFLRSLMRHFGADAQLIPVEDGNPIVVGVFKGGKSSSSSDNLKPQDITGKVKNLNISDDSLSSKVKDSKCRILFYGHYDVIIADKTTDRWDTEPYEMCALDGYLYGRGVSDNKGPVLAAIFAVAELVQRSELENDVVFVIEGEEECGSRGFQETIHKYRDYISGKTNCCVDSPNSMDTSISLESTSGISGSSNSALSTESVDPESEVDWVLLSNSYWLDDITPCLNYGLRGIIKANVVVKGIFPDLHSGVYGGTYREPTMDLVKLLSKLSTDDGTILLPALHDNVRPVDQEEKKLYDAILSKTKLFDDKNAKIIFNDTSLSTDETVSDGMKQLMARWRYPSLTIHRIDVSGPGNSTLIPQCASATISLRIVPDQDIPDIKKDLMSYLHEQFLSFKSSNELTVDIFHEADPWVGDITNKSFTVLKEAIEQEWGEPPIFIREGGSIPAVRFLEKEFNAPAAQLPCGQASDGAHMNNERLRVMNFLKTRNVLEHTFKTLRK